MLYKFLNNKFGHALIKGALAAFWVLCALIAFLVMMLAFPDEVAALGGALVTVIGFIVVIGGVGIFLWFMPRIYIFFIPLKLLTIIAMIIVFFQMFTQVFIPRLEEVSYGAIAHGPTFVITCSIVVAVLIVGIPLLKKLYAVIKAKIGAKVFIAHLNEARAAQMQQNGLLVNPLRQNTGNIGNAVNAVNTGNVGNTVDIGKVGNPVNTGNVSNTVSL